MLKCRNLIAGVLCLSALGTAGAQDTQDPSRELFPSRPVRALVPFPPGSTLDALVRIVADQLAQKWKQPVIVDNVSGGGGNIGTTRFARSAPDGYTLLFAPPGPFTINPLLYADVSYDPATFAAISLLATVPNVLVTRVGIAENLPQLIAIAKANPKKLTYATQGVGSTAFLTAKLFEARTGIEMVHVPYRGAGPALNDLMAGHVDMMFDTIVTSLPLHRAEKARIIAVASDKRLRVLPDVPTISETVAAGLRSVSWFGTAAPQGTPPAIVDKINGDLSELLRQPAVDARLRELQLDPVGSTPSEMATFLKEETALWSKVIRDADVKPQ